MKYIGRGGKKMTRAEMLADLKDARNTALDKVLPVVKQIMTGRMAKQYDIMRESVKLDIQQQIARDKANNVITLDFSPDHVDELIYYLKYHDVDHPEFNRYYATDHYKHPSTPGTVPWRPSELLPEAKIAIVNAIRQELTARGYKLK